MALHGRFRWTTTESGVGGVALCARPKAETANSTLAGGSYPQVAAKIVLDKQWIIRFNTAFDPNTGRPK